MMWTAAAAAATALGRTIRPYLPDIRDLHVYGGITLVAIGVGWVWPPAALIVVGVALVLLGMVKFS